MTCWGLSLHLSLVEFCSAKGVIPQTLMVAEWQFCPPKLMAQSINYSTLVEATGVAGGGLLGREGGPGVEEGSLAGGIPGCLLFLVEDVCGNLDQATCLHRRFLSRQEAELLWSENSLAWLRLDFDRRVGM